jgi:hypothetical protein
MIAPGDTVTSDGYALGHVDCDTPRGLTPEERVLLYVYCWDHDVAGCDACERRFRQDEIGSDFYSIHGYRCLNCRTDLTEHIRLHLAVCEDLPEQLRRRVQMARETTQRLLKQSHELVDRADMLMRETEAIRAALREARTHRRRDVSES